MISKIKCPFHKEETPSCAVYPDGYYCFGCGAYGPLSDLEGLIDFKSIKVREPENLEESMEYIANLPQDTIRGLNLHYDSSGYYVLWPRKNYYNKRYFNSGSSKYRKPAGHRQPLFIPQYRGTRECYYVEGELNAMSIAQVVNSTVVSPGGVAKFPKYAYYLNRFDYVYIVADRDEVGTLAAMELSTNLNTPNKILLMEKDANDWLVDYGPEGLRDCLETLQQEAREVKREVAG